MKSYIPGFARFLMVLEGLKNSTAMAYRRHIEEFVAWYEDNRKVGGAGGVANRQDVEAFLEACYFRGNSNQTRHTKLTALTKFSRYLKYEKVISEDFTAEIPKPKIVVNRIQKFTKEEVLKFFGAVDPTIEKGLRDVVIFILAVFCGLRIGEICSLALADVIDDGKDIDIAISELIGKKGRSRTIYVWKAPGKFVRLYAAVRLSHGAKISDPLLVSYKYKRPSSLPLNATAVNKLIKTYAAKAGIRKAKITCHMFRATHANDLRYIEGYDAPAIAGRLGHANIATTDRYLPDRGRVHKIYPSLAAYWQEFNHLWREKNADDDGGSAPDHAPGGSGDPKE